jgi:hypothetical protein
MARMLDLGCGRSLVRVPVVSTKDYEIGTYCFLADHAVLRSKSKDESGCVRVGRHVYLRTVLSVS